MSYRHDNDAVFLVLDTLKEMMGEAGVWTGSSIVSPLLERTSLNRGTIYRKLKTLHALGIISDRLPQKPEHLRARQYEWRLLKPHAQLVWNKGYLKVMGE